MSYYYHMKLWWWWNITIQRNEFHPKLGYVDIYSIDTPNYISSLLARRIIAHLLSTGHTNKSIPTSIIKRANI